MSAWFRVLGDIEVEVDGHGVDIGHARPRGVLAVLLADANRVVATDQLVERVWGREPRPADPRAALRTYVSQLRRALPDAAFVRQAPGYKLIVDERRVDLYRFDHLLAEARAADDDRAAALLQEALGLWRGEPFAGLDTPWSVGVRQNLLLRRRAARLDLTDVQLRRGRHASLLAELTDQAAEQPLDERVAGQLMLALYRSGRQDGALAHYRRVHRLLADELGADPGPSLRELHQRILAADPALAAPAPEPVTVQARPGLIPRQLPAGPRLFTGRVRELARLEAALDERSEPGGTLMISAIGGAGGIGKTWLALHWAHQHLDRFPDGQLYVNLRGFDPSGEPMPAATAVRGFLDALGAPPDAIPADADAQAGLYRSIVAGRRMLIVADNARDAAQVAPLLPGDSTCTVLVTSRRRLTGLISAHGAHALDLDVLPEREARHLLTRHLGTPRIAAEPDAVTTLLGACAGLPLALSVVAARALTRPDLPLAVLAEELGQTAARLDGLAAGDLSANVKAALSWSYDALPAEAARVLGLLALAPGPDIGLAVAASLTALPTDHVRTVLRDLEDAHLLQQQLPGRYRMHDLVRLYATERAHTDQPDEERTAALRRVVDFYVHTSQAALRLVEPRRRAPFPEAPPPGCVPYQPPDLPAALAWFEQESPGLSAAQHASYARTWDLRVWHLAWTLGCYQWRRADLPGMLATWRLGLDAAERLGSPGMECCAHQELGPIYTNLGRQVEALDHARRAVALGEQAALPAAMQVHSYSALADALEARGRYQEALGHAERMLHLARDAGNPIFHAQALGFVGWLNARLGDYDRGRTSCLAALDLLRRNGDHDSLAVVLRNLGAIAHHAHHDDEALGYYREAVDLAHETGNTNLEGWFLDDIADIHLALGQPDEAREAWNRVLALCQAQHRPAAAAYAQRRLAELVT